LLAAYKDKLSGNFTVKGKLMKKRRTSGERAGAGRAIVPPVFFWTCITSCRPPFARHRPFWHAAFADVAVCGGIGAGHGKEARTQYNAGRKTKKGRRPPQATFHLFNVFVVLLDMF
jgi:hypothetical protein